MALYGGGGSGGVIQVMRGRRNLHIGLITPSSVFIKEITHAMNIIYSW